MSDLQNAAIKLMSSPHYKELATYEPPFNPFEIVGATHLELIHSSVLAWLLRDEANKEFRQKFVTWISDGIVAEAKKTNKPLEWKKLWKGFVAPRGPEYSSLKPKTVKTEEGDKASRYDVSVHFESLKLVIGIEVKVWAGEQPKQVERYQELLCQNYPPDYKKVVVFLTPKGRPPTTADGNNVYVPVLAMSWDCVSEIIREMRSASGDENSFRMQFSQHIERNIVTNEREEKRIVRELLSEGDNEETLDKIIKNMPSLLDYSDQWKKIVAEVCCVEQDNLEEVIYPKRGGIVKELKIRIPEWCKAGLPFTLMLYKYQKAGVRILLHKDDCLEGSEPKVELKEFANCSGGVVNIPTVDNPVDNWNVWHPVLTKHGKDEEVKGTLIDDIWGEGWADEAEKRLREQIEDSGLLQQINEWIEHKKRK